MFTTFLWNVHITLLSEKQWKLSPINLMFIKTPPRKFSIVKMVSIDVEMSIRNDCSIFAFFCVYTQADVSICI